MYNQAIKNFGWGRTVLKRFLIGSRGCRVNMGLSTTVEICEIRDATLAGGPLELPANVVHVWKQTLGAAQATLDACYEFLPTQERERASRFRAGRPRDTFVVTRGTLRLLIARYLGKTPQALSFQYTQFGKPFLEGQSDLHFNVSHTDGVALIAFVRVRDIGVDVEKIHPQHDVRKLANRFFSVRERQQLDSLRGDELYAAFFRCWTRKEAYIKAKGEGLSLPLHQFDVSVRANELQALLATRPDASEAGNWIVRDLSISPEYAAALAVRDAGEN